MGEEGILLLRSQALVSGNFFFFYQKQVPVAKMWKINNIKIKIIPFEIYHNVNTIPKIICHSN
jgi:hypothetical protein